MLCLSEVTSEACDIIFTLYYQFSDSKYMIVKLIVYQFIVWGTITKMLDYSSEMVSFLKLNAELYDDLTKLNIFN